MQHTKNELSFSMHDKPADNYYSLLECLKNSGPITHINIDYEEYWYSGQLSEVLKRNTSLISMSICCDGNDSSMANELSGGLKFNKTLQTLTLCICNADDMIVDMCEALKENDSLLTLEISGCDVGDEGAFILADILETNKTLKKLLLKYNEIGNDGAIALQESLKHNSTIEEINLCGNNISTTIESSIIKHD